ncbi:MULTISPECIES: response regulator transcription factor [unclassified Lysinibacillus]|uniref:response regulator n=1 Tax=unclassified Lysinibacillus TaxID=2636778 RepID=UPI002011F2C8|nr:MULTISPECIES: response regulator transcription factor [unclassified Lysinibacillus]MCL1698020.1 response regulator transcription factor [Lysinibacillus sp. BPa_S21]MCL1703008.1 response regulator transcription factor [Lysinibacillus sp. Bpr_S20]
MIRVLVVDDHVLIRKGIVLLLENYIDIEVVGEAGDGAEAIIQATSLNPDVILMDVSIPNGLDGFTATQEIHKQMPNVKIIMLTMHNEVAYIQKAIAVEANGYILKNSQGGILYEAIHAVYSGRIYYNVGIPQEQLDKLFEHKGHEDQCILTVREQEIMRLTVLGYTNIQIAGQLYISSKTVENHKSNIMQKLNLSNKAELIQYGLTNNYM